MVQHCKNRLSGPELDPNMSVERGKENDQSRLLLFFFLRLSASLTGLTRHISTPCPLRFALFISSSLQAATLPDFLCGMLVVSLPPRWGCLMRWCPCSNAFEASGVQRNPGCEWDRESAKAWVRMDCSTKCLARVGA